MEDGAAGRTRRALNASRIIERLNKELRSMIESEEMTKRIVADGGDPITSTPEEYAANIEREEGKWAALIKKLGLKIE